MNKFLILFSTVVFAGCAKSSGNNFDLETKKESLSYEFEFNGCKTGKRHFNSSADMCRGLQNNTLNNSCAIEMREEYFKAHCQGQTFAPFDQ